MTPSGLSYEHPAPTTDSVWASAASGPKEKQGAYALQRWSDRRIIDFVEYSATGSSKSGSVTQPLEEVRVVANGEVSRPSGYLSARFAGTDGVYQVRLLIEKPLIANGISLRFRLRGWEGVRYVALGYTHEGLFRHVKIANAACGNWVDFSVAHNDLAFRIQNQWASPTPAMIADVRLYVKGTPAGSVAWADIESAASWLEDERPGWLDNWEPTASCRTELLNCIYEYLNKCFRSANEQALSYLNFGKCPLYGDVLLEWDALDTLPTALQEVGTYRFSWHSLHPAVILMMHARESGNDAALFAAREFVSDWLARSYFAVDADKKYAWYDHGTAERVLAMVIMWAIGVDRRFDRRFMQRLRDAIFRHGQLLSSEVFYASHQPTRYHNHAWFQDIALIACSMAMEDYPCANDWFSIALSRLGDQFEKLIVRDGNYAVFVENSFGYHLGIQRLVEFAGALVTLAGAESHIPSIAKELGTFSEFLRYPDNRAPAQGDTFRRSNASGSSVLKLKPFAQAACSILPRAGYAVAKGNHDAARFMIIMFATSLCRTHKHEDNLSFTLHFDGLEWLVDPSFYSHEYSAPIPAYLRSATAHNVLAMPGRPYSIEAGTSSLDGRTVGLDYVFFGQHTAYEGVVVERQMRGRTDRLALDVEDRATCRAAGSQDEDLRLMFHCGEGVRAYVDRSTVKLVHPDSSYAINLSLPSGEIVVYHGRTDEPAIRGVTGLGFMKYSPIDTIECRVPFDTTIHWALRATGESTQ